MLVLRKLCAREIYNLKETRTVSDDCFRVDAHWHVINKFIHHVVSRFGFSTHFEDDLEILYSFCPLSKLYDSIATKDCI